MSPIPLLIDGIYLSAFFVFALLSVPFAKIRNSTLHAFTRNFWGHALPVLDGRPAVWFHAVSVGEAMVSVVSIKHLAATRPDLQMVLSISTRDGMAAAQCESLEASLLFAPFDFSWAVRRTFDAVRPVALIIAENDFWPNMLNEARRRNVPLAIFNTRMSVRELREHRWNAWLLRPGLKRAVWWGAITQQDADWIRHFFHVDPSRLEVTGSCKFDGIVRDPQDTKVEELRTLYGILPDEKILVAGSTHAPEEEILGGLFQSLSREFPRLRLILVPRHVNRCDEIACMLERQKITVCRTSLIADQPPTPGSVILVDSVGLLRDVWGLASFGFVGGSLARHGGQNPIEPCSYGVAVCLGPHTWNFQSVVEDFLGVQGAVQIGSANELESTIRHWLTDPENAIAIGQRARQLVAERTQARDRTIRGIESILPPPINAPRTNNEPGLEAQQQATAAGER